jgi:hypothetical protein
MASRCRPFLTAAHERLDRRERHVGDSANGSDPVTADSRYTDSVARHLPSAVVALSACP